MAGEGAHLSGMAGRYATALFELALEANALDAVKADLEAFNALVAQSADLARVVRSPVFSSDEQVRALSAVLERAGLRGLSAQFLLAVASNRRLFAVRDIIRTYQRARCPPPRRGRRASDAGAGAERAAHGSDQAGAPRRHRQGRAG